MIRIALIGVVSAAGLLLSACETTYGGGSAGYRYGRGYDVWYDGFYGAYTDGYWDGSVFLYSDGRGGYLRDSGNHFRRGQFTGSHRYHWRPH